MSGASNVTLKHPTGPWWTIYGTAGEITQQIQQVFPHLTGGPTDFPLIVAQASSEWASLVSATSSTSTPGGAGSGGAPNDAAGDGTPSCLHGPMKWVESKPGAPRAWKGWFCSGPRELSRDQKCPTDWQ